MSVVIDASAVLAVLLNEPQRAAIIEITRGVNLCAPPSLRWEVGNALSALLRRGAIKVKQVRQALASYQKIPVRLRDVSLEETLDIAARFGIYAYDAYMLACARNGKCPLLTLDRGLIRAAGKLEIETLEVSP